MDKTLAKLLCNNIKLATEIIERAEKKEAVICMLDYIDRLHPSAYKLININKSYILCQ